MALCFYQIAVIKLKLKCMWCSEGEDSFRCVYSWCVISPLNIPAACSEDFTLGRAKERCPYSLKHLHSKLQTILSAQSLNENASPQNSSKQVLRTHSRIKKNFLIFVTWRILGLQLKRVMRSDSRRASAAGGGESDAHTSACLLTQVKTVDSLDRSKVLLICC